MTKELNKEKNNGGKSRLDEMKEIARKYGVKVTDGADRGIRAIGIIGGISQKYTESASGVTRSGGSEPLPKPRVSQTQKKEPDRED